MQHILAEKRMHQVLADGQKIHPALDVEAQPTRQLVPPGSAASEKGHPIRPPPPPPPPRPPPPPPPRTLPAAIYPRPPKTRSCWCKCICWTISLLVVLIIAFATTVGILYLVFQPKMPKYSVDRLNISSLRLNFDLTLYAKFDVKITANNPNKKIGIYYEKGSRLSVWYSNTKLCQGSIPRFYQGHQNTTKLDVSLTGQVESGSTLMSALQEQQQTGRIPLDLKVDAPVAIKLGRLKLRRVRTLGDCLLVVDSLTTNNLISIQASNCKFRLKL